MFKNLLKESALGGLAGIGISLILMIMGTRFDSFYNLSWSALFGFYAGFSITFFVEAGLNLGKTIAPTYFNKMLLPQLALSYIISSGVYFMATTSKNWFFNQNPYPFEVLRESLGMGVASMMIALYFITNNENNQLLRLEKEHQRLAVLDERNRIARELHDSVSQNLFGINLNLNTINHLIESDPKKAKEIIRLIQGMTEEVQTEMRLMIYGLRPVTLAEKGFFEAIESLVSLYRVRYGLEINCSLSGEENLDTQKQSVLYRVLQESMNNIVKHARAHKVKVSLSIENGCGELRIQDDGAGFAINAVNANEHIGISAMKERAEQVKGVFNIQSIIGKGTNVTVKF